MPSASTTWPATSAGPLALRGCRGKTASTAGMEMSVTTGTTMNASRQSTDASDPPMKLTTIIDTALNAANEPIAAAILPCGTTARM